MSSTKKIYFRPLIGGDRQIFTLRLSTGGSFVPTQNCVAELTYAEPSTTEH